MQVHLSRDRTSAAPACHTGVSVEACAAAAMVVVDEYLPGDVLLGDLLAVASAGASCWGLASSYLRVGRPPVVAVADGVPRILVRGESIDDLLARDTGVVPGA